MAELIEQGAGYGPPAPVPIFQWAAEFEPLLALYREVQPKHVLEIGTYHGGTLYHWLHEATPGTLIVSLDSYAVGVDNREQYPDWVPEDVQLHVIEADSRDSETLECVSEWAPYDWLFIDAGHYYHEVRSDWEMYGPLVEPGGHVIFHDILTSEEWPSIEVEKLWREVQRAGFWTREIVADENAKWGGLGLVRI